MNTNLKEDEHVQTEEFNGQRALPLRHNLTWPEYESYSKMMNIPKDKESEKTELRVPKSDIELGDSPIQMMPLKHQMTPAVTVFYNYGDDDGGAVYESLKRVFENLELERGKESEQSTWVPETESRLVTIVDEGPNSHGNHILKDSDEPKSRNSITLPIHNNSPRITSSSQSFFKLELPIRQRIHLEIREERELEKSKLVIDPSVIETFAKDCNITTDEAESFLRDHDGNVVWAESFWRMNQVD